MSNEPTSTTPTIAAAALRDGRWIAATLWLGLLAALLVTSAYSVSALAGTGVVSTFGFVSFAERGSQDTPLDEVASWSVAVSALAAAGLFMAWLAFVRATRALVIAFSEDVGDPAAAPVIAEWLPPASTETDGPASTRTAATDVLLFLGATWVILLVGKAVLNVVAAYA
jgi:hypothetical protein